MNKISWGLAEILLGIVVIVVGWALSIEVRMAQHNTLETISDRVGKLEELMLPVLVDYKVRQLERKDMPPRFYGDAPTESGLVTRGDNVSPVETKKKRLDNATDWARQAMQVEER